MTSILHKFPITEVAEPPLAPSPLGSVAEWSAIHAIVMIKSRYDQARDIYED
jgi:hypothetical protein